MYTITAALSRFGALLLVPLFWQRLTPADYGAIAIAEMIATIVGSYIGLSLETGMSRLYFEWPGEERSRRLGAVWMAHWGSAIGLAAVSLPVIALLAPVMFPKVDFYPVAVFGVAYAALSRMKAFTIATLRIKRLLWTFSVLHLGGFAIYAGLEIYFVMVRGMGLHGYLYGMVIAEGIAVLACIVIMRGIATPCLRGAHLRDVLRYSLPLVPNSMLGTASAIVDTFVLQYVAPLRVLGIYSVSSRFVGLIPALADALKMSFAPFLYQTTSERGAEAPGLIARVRMFYLLPLVIGGACVALFTEDVVRWIDRAEYFEVIDYVPLLVGPAMIDAMQVYFTSGLLLAKRTDLMWIPTVSRLATIVTSGLLLIPVFGIDGLIASRYITTLVNLTVAFQLSQRHYYIPVAWLRMLALYGALVASVVVGAFSHTGSAWLDLALDIGIAVGYAGIALAAVLLRRAPEPAEDAG